MSVDEFNRIVQYRYAGVSAPEGVIVNLDYTSTSNTVYIGYALRGSADSGSSWKVKRESFDGNGRLTSVRWSLRGQAWNDRTSLTYA